MMIPLGDIRRMLEDCAPGSRIEPKEHRNWVYYNKLIYRGLPLAGRHGRHHKPEIWINHVRHMVDYLKINRDCVHRYFPQMFKHASH
jgi:hypothetical protein